MRRRSVLAAMAVLPVAGCLGSSGDPAPTDDEFEALPWSGAHPQAADHLIVAFEDPACSSCANFHATQFPTVSAELLETEEASFVHRPYAVVADWSEMGAAALHATAAQDREIAVELFSWYYSQQATMSRDILLPQTEGVLEETAVDAGAVVEAVEDGTYEEAVQETIDVGEAEGATTPTFFLYRDDERVTTLTGNQDANTVITALRDG